VSPDAEPPTRSRKPGDRRDLKTTNNAKGTIKYKPATGATKIIAEVSQNGLLRETKTVVLT
jgi:hypothetical protein